MADGSVPECSTGVTREAMTLKGADGRLMILWDQQPQPGDSVLMSVELFSQCVAAVNALQGH